MVPAKESASNILEIEQILVRLGLPFLLEHPGRSMGIYLKKLGKKLIRKLLWLIGAVLLVFLGALAEAEDVVDPRTISASHPFAWGKYYADAFRFSLMIVAIYLLWRIGRAIMPTVRSWARVGSTLALMFSFVTFYFFTGDAWRFFGGMAWWRLIALACFLTAIALPSLYSHANRAFQAAKRQDLPSGGLAGFNLRAVVTLLLARRILVSGFIVLLVLFFFGMVMIDQHASQSLMHPATAGWSKTMGAFFLSEALVKVALSVAGLTAAYFVVVTLTDDALKAPNAEETMFIDRVSVLWYCYKGKLARRDAVTLSSGLGWPGGAAIQMSGEGPVGTENLCHQAIFMNPSCAVAPLDPDRKIT